VVRRCRIALLRSHIVCYCISSIGENARPSKKSSFSLASGCLPPGKVFPACRSSEGVVGISTSQLLSFLPLTTHLFLPTGISVISKSTANTAMEVQTTPSGRVKRKQSGNKTKTLPCPHCQRLFARLVSPILHQPSRPGSVLGNSRKRSSCADD
jgi:hypothetical protein